MSIKRSIQQAVFRSIRTLRSLIRGRVDGNCILVLEYMLPLGGCVHATPLFTALRAGQPLPIYVATRGLGLEVLRHNPDIAGLLPTSDVFQSLPGTIQGLRRALRERNLIPSWTITDAGNQRSTIALLGAAVGAPIVGYNQAEGLLHTVLKRDPSNSTMIAENVAIAAAIGVKSPITEPRVFTSSAAAVLAKQLLQTVNPSGLPVVLFATQGSGGQPTEWHADRFVRVIEDVSKRGMISVFIGSAVQSAAIDNLRSSAACETASLAGKTDIPTLAALMALSDLCVAIDSGPMHMARASKVPLVVLAPTYQSPIEWLPLEVPTARVLRGPGIHPAPPGYKLDEIEVPEVLAAVTDLLDAYPPSAVARESRLAAIITAVDHLA